jgi:membrane protein implicated in regulation of membrane protease activity
MSFLAWLVLGVLLLVLEMLTPGVFFVACLGVGALVASLSALAGLPTWVDWAVFFSVSFLLVLFVAPIAKRWMKKMPSAPVGLDSVEGQIALVTEDVDPGTGKGQVRLANGSVWLVASDRSMAKGSRVEIKGITGTRLRVSQVSEDAPSRESP